MSEEVSRIVGWEGSCFIPAQAGEPDETGRIPLMEVHTGDTRLTPEEAWKDAEELGGEYDTPFRGIQPVLENTKRRRKILTFVVFE
jgi:hypothetical protein